MYATLKDKKIPVWEQERVKNRTWVAIVIITFIVILITLYTHFHVQHREQWYVALREQRPDADIMIKTPDIKLKEIICKTHHDICYYIMDSDYGSSSRLRRLQIEPHYHTVLCAVFVDDEGRIIPDKIWMSYIRMTLYAPYIFGVFKPGVSKRILQIGLGGGSFAAFLEWLPEKHDITTIELEPVIVHIAKRWFNVPSTDRHRVIENDGFQFIMERSEDAPKYDFVLVDTAYDDDFHLMMAPVVIFARDEFASGLRKHMNSTSCAVVVNTYTHHKELEKLLDAEKFRHDTLHIYRKYYGSCFFVETGSNNMLFCSCQRIGDMTQLKFDKLVQTIPHDILSMLRVKYLVRSDW